MLSSLQLCVRGRFHAIFVTIVCQGQITCYLRYNCVSGADFMLSSLPLCVRGFEQLIDPHRSVSQYKLLCRQCRCFLTLSVIISSRHTVISPSTALAFFSAPLLAAAALLFFG